MTARKADRNSLERLDALSGRRLIVIGDVILDRYLWGESDRLSPEAPAPVVREGDVTEALGGAGNVARNLIDAGAKVEVVGVIGCDEAGARVRELMAELGLGARGLIEDATRPTTVKTRVMSRGQQLLRIDRESDGACAKSIETRLARAIARLTPRCAAAILSDYRKGVVQSGIVRAAARAARKAAIPLIADPKRTDFGFYKGADYLTPNLKETSEAVGETLDSDRSVARAGKALLRRFGGMGVAITRGHDGVSLIGPNRSDHLAARAREVYDVTGAGDTFIAHFALALAAGFPAVEAARVGNAAAGVAVAKIGAATVSPPELAAAMGVGEGSSKVRTVEDLRLLLDRLRSRRRRIVLTNGCFDLFHAGHVRLLNEARALGDFLVVAVNSDASIRRIKGAPRPILPETERAAVLGAQPSVDCIVFFDEDTPEALLEKLRPDVLVKGRRKGERIVGRKIVERHGGKVVELPIANSSTTAEAIERVRRSKDRTKP